MAIRSALPGYSTAEAKRALEGLPRCDYEVVIKPLRYRWRPHLAARCEFEERRIVLQVPSPFRAFEEPVNYAGGASAARACGSRGHQRPWRFAAAATCCGFSTATSGCTGTCTRCWVGGRAPRPRAIALLCAISAVVT